MRALMHFLGKNVTYQYDYILAGELCVNIVSVAHFQITGMDIIFSNRMSENMLHFSTHAHPLVEHVNVMGKQTKLSLFLFNVRSSYVSNTFVRVFQGVDSTHSRTSTCVNCFGAAENVMAHIAARKREHCFR